MTGCAGTQADMKGQARFKLWLQVLKSSLTKAAQSHE